MPLRRQQSAEDTGTQYIPPPNAKQDVNDARRATPTNGRTIPLNQANRGTLDHAAAITRGLLGGLRDRAERIAQDRAERAAQLAQERAEREARQSQERTEREVRQSPTRQATAPVQHHRHTAAVGAPGLSWRQHMYVYTILLLVGYSVWVFDGAFTVIGAVTTIIPATLTGIGIAIAGHFFVSWGQHTLIFHPHLAIKALGLVLLGVNATSNIYGVTGAAKALRPGLLGTLPEDPKTWIGELATWSGSLLRRAISPASPAVKTPGWLFTAVIMLVLAVVLAWYAEKIRDYFHAQWKMIWSQRPR